MLCSWVPVGRNSIISWHRCPEGKHSFFGRITFQHYHLYSFGQCSWAISPFQIHCIEYNMGTIHMLARTRMLLRTGLVISKKEKRYEEECYFFHIASFF